MRLDAFIASNSILSRRAAQYAIQKGEIKVNDKIIIIAGHRITGDEKIFWKEQCIKTAANQYYLALHKPHNYITTRKDEQGRRNVMSLLSSHPAQRQLVPIGRLDRNTTGLLLFSNNGQFVYQMSHPKFQITKVYRAHFYLAITSLQLNQLKKGVILSDGKVILDALHYDPKAPKTLHVTLHSGKNRVLRRLFEAIHLPLQQLCRLQVGNVHLDKLPLGKWRKLTKSEITASLKQSFIEKFN